MTRMVHKVRIQAVAGVIAASALCSQALSAGGAASSMNLDFEGKGFERLLLDSYQARKAGAPSQFLSWWDRACRQACGMGATEWVRAARSKIASSKDKIAAERRLGEDLHRIVKKAIPKFSLDRGFEFANVPLTHERQCLLQSVLIASMLRDAGMNAGVVMVWESDQGSVSNLGHAAAMVQLSPRDDTLVDASDAAPHAPHPGLFVREADGAYHFVRASYNKGGDVTGWTSPSGRKIPYRRVRALDWPYVRSQFDFYRAERTPHGLLDRSKTPDGMAASEKWLRESLRVCPENPLSELWLSRVLKSENRTRESAAVLAKARVLYRKFGWEPPSMRNTHS